MATVSRGRFSVMIAETSWLAVSMSVNFLVDAKLTLGAELAKKINDPR